MHENPCFSDCPKSLQPVIDAIANAIAMGAPGVLLVGPPGIGKTMIARRIPGIMPAMTEHERRWSAIELDAAGLGDRVLRVASRPFRAPHHTCSTAALCGMRRDAGGSTGELRLARFGVLMLDELTEFRLATIDALRFPLKRMGNGAPFIVATAMPCLCGWYGSDDRACVCSARMIRSHVDRLRKFSDLLGITKHTIAIPHSVTLQKMRDQERCAPSDVIRATVECATSNDDLTEQSLLRFLTSNKSDGTITVSELRYSFGKPAQTITALLKRLVARGYLMRQRKNRTYVYRLVAGVM